MMISCFLKKFILRENCMKPTVAKRFRKQMDLLTGDERPISELFLHRSLIPLPKVRL